MLRLDRALTLYCVQPLRRVVGGTDTNSLPILMYHSVSESAEGDVPSYYRTATSPQVFGEHMAWLRANGWQRDWLYNDNFKDKQVAGAYQKTFSGEYPVYIDSGIYAVLGGWHLPFPDPDWQELIDEHLMVMTIRDSEPWVEAWRTRAGQFGVIQRTT